MLNTVLCLVNTLIINSNGMYVAADNIDYTQ